MSIYRQLWLAVLGLTILAFSGSFVLSIYTARGYIEQQLRLKNIDNASSLGLVLSQLPVKDPVTVELLISTQFDTGHYQQIILSGTKHETLVERHYSGPDNGAPGWFVNLFPIRADAGTALVQDGWMQYGTLKVVSHSRFAYRELWQGAIRLAGWFALAGVAAGILGTVLLRFIFLPLTKVVDQANAIQERRFITVSEPRTPELRGVVVAMNAMVVRLRNMFTEEANRLDELRREINHDALSGLPNRGFFMTWLSEALAGDEAAASGVLAITRIADLERVNAALGYTHADTLIKDIGQCLEKLASRDEKRLAARLNGSDFAFVVAGDDDATGIGSEIRDAIAREVNPKWPQLADIFHVGSVAFFRNEPLGDVLASVDKALAMAENMGANSFHSLDARPGAVPTRTSEAWRQVLGEALSQGRVRLENFPVLALNGTVLHHEGAVRIQPETDGSWLSAGEFMPMALRLKLAAKVDVGVIRMALDHLGHHGGQIAVNISAESIADWGFRDELIAMLGRAPELCRRLWLEVPEYGAFRHFDAFRSLCQQLASLDCKLGIEHFGRNFSEIAKLAELGLDYLKVDSSYVRDIDKNPGNQEFLKGLCKMAHTVGVQVIGEGVQSEQELDTLLGIGFDAATGQAVTRKLNTGA